MLMAVEENVTVAQRTQLTFSFISPEDAGKTPKRRRRSGNVKKTPPTVPITKNEESREQHEQLKEAALALHALGRKFIPVTEFRDYATFTRCAKILQETGAIKEVPLELNATIADHESALITHAPQYRRLRNRAIAGLATVADLGAKAPGKGSADYQKGVRDAYRHASDVAALFLEDIQEGI